MESASARGPVSTRVIRWIARTWTVASAVLVVLFIVGERSLPSTATEWLGFVFFPVGVSVGMILAWRREGLGGGIAVGSLVVFYLIHIATAGTVPRGLAWLLFAAPGFLFLWCWYRSRGSGAA